MGQGNGGIRAIYTSSVADLGTLDNEISRIEVISNLESQEAIGESNSISADQEWETVLLTQTYDDPVVIAGAPLYVGVDPTTFRIRNVTGNSFEIQIDEWEYLNPFHAAEVVSYMVVEAGRYTLADGIIDFSDISPFISLLLSGDYQDEADIDRNAAVTFDDIDLFISILLGA